MHQLWIETIVCNFVKPVGLYLYSHICLHAVGSMAPKCTSVVTLTVNSCGWDHTNYPRHATNHSLARWYLNCKDISQYARRYLHLSQIARISLSICTMFAASVLLISHFQPSDDMDYPRQAASTTPPYICTLISQHVKLGHWWCT